MIRVKNCGREVIQVMHSEAGWCEYLRPGDEREFTGNGRGQAARGHFIIEPSHPTRDPRFDPRGGDPYNRIGQRVFS
jgi:hypothetical protein